MLQAQEILALNNLPALAGIATELAQVVGGAANNIDQIIEINKGQRERHRGRHAGGEPGRSHRQGHERHRDAAPG